MADRGGHHGDSNHPFDLARRLAEAEQALAEQGRQLAAARARELLLNRLARIQRSITRRGELQQTLDAVTGGAHELLRDEVTLLRLVDADDPSVALLVSSAGLDTHAIALAKGASLGNGVAGRAVREARTIVAVPSTSDAGLQGMHSAMAVPVIEDGRVVGSLIVATADPHRRYDHGEQDALISFADHAGRALADAHAVENRLHQALHDPLTELPNRALFLDRIGHVLMGARRDPTGMGILFIDVDRFRTLNDALGHPGGDAVLREVAARLRGCLRAGDTAARLGGDQFGIIVTPAAEPGDVTPVAERVLEAMRAPMRAGDRAISISVSIGIALADGTAAEPGELLRDADIAMCAARTHGRGRYEVFDPQLRASTAERLEIEADLHAALGDEEDGEERFTVFYQPIVGLDSGRTAAFEALVRWDHPERGLLLPGEFIPVAEESSLIVPMGRVVLRRAFRDLRAWREDHPEMDLTVSVNLSPAEFGEEALVDDVLGALDNASIPASSLILEITESVFLRDSDDTVSKLWALRGAGVRIAIDDFGTGYSSLGYLRRFPIDMIKIDKSFIDGVAGKEDDAALARAIIKLGHMLRLQIVAEGIESGDQLETLRALRCQFGQGFHFSAPLDRKAVMEYLAVMGGAPEHLQHAAS